MGNTIDENSNIDSDTRFMKCIRGYIQDTKSLFMCILKDWEGSTNSQIPVKLENIFQNKRESQEDRYLNDMWKDMELALKESTLNSSSLVGNFIVLTLKAQL